MEYIGLLISIAFGMLIFLAPIYGAIWILRQLDRAAKQRKGKVKIFLADLFCLFFLFQLPLVLCHDQFDEPLAIMVAIVFSCLMVLVGWTTIKTVSKAGIQTCGWRSLISLVVIPSTYFGSFVLIAAILSIGNADNKYYSVAIATLCAIALISSAFITKNALAVAQSEASRSPSVDDEVAKLNR